MDVIQSGLAFRTESPRLRPLWGLTPPNDRPRQNGILQSLMSPRRRGPVVIISYLSPIVARYAIC
jgi:hypothetical protein